jgi:hypothetical protein
MDSSDESKKNFFKHVFNFDDESKSDMLNKINNLRDDFGEELLTGLYETLKNI